MPLVLVHNDVVRNPAHAWDDKEGVHYHYPSKYQGKIQTGERFVYYRGVHRIDGRRGPAEYVGAGRIGAIWLDPKTEGQPRKAWYCAVEDFRRFAVPVPAKIERKPLEEIPANLWRDGVRSLAASTYAQIMSFAGEAASTADAPGPSSVTIATSDALVVPAAIVGSGGGSKSSYRKSKQAKAIGDWAEAIALRYVQEQIAKCSNCVHRAAIGETPGWDLDYWDAAGELQRVEVKGTVAAAFSGVDLTAGEMRAAKLYGDTYWICLVANCQTPNPIIQMVRNPAERLAAGEWTAIPSIYAVRFTRR